MKRTSRASEARSNAVAVSRRTVRGFVCWISLAAAAAGSAGCAAAIAGTGSVGSWGRVERLGAGQRVVVRRLNGEVSQGVVTGVDAEAITVSEAQSGVSERVFRQTVRQIQLVQSDRADSVKNGATFGAIVGIAYVVAGLAYVAANGDGGEPSTGASATAGATGVAIGAGVGALIDVARKRPRRVTIYRR